jgi:hypothetical protein
MHEVSLRSEMNALYNGASVKAVTSSVQELQAIKVDQFCGKYAALDVYGPQNAMARKVLNSKWQTLKK